VEYSSNWAATENS